MSFRAPFIRIGAVRIGAVRGAILGGLLAAVLVGIAVVSLVGVDQEVSDREQRETQGAAFADLAATLHTIDRIEFFGWNANVGSAGIVMRGNRSGDYRISWQVTEPTSGHVLVAGRKVVSLGPGRRTVVISLARDGLIEAYRESVLKEAGRGVIDEVFRLAATVELVPSPEESAALPPLEIQNLAIGQSSLRSVAGTDLPVSFQLPVAPAVQTD